MEKRIRAIPIVDLCCIGVSIDFAFSEDETDAMKPFASQIYSEALPQKTRKEKKRHMVLSTPQGNKK